jgi:hypothetical protein
LFAGSVETVAHVGSLTHGRVQKPKMHQIALRRQHGLVNWHRIGC